MTTISAFSTNNGNDSSSTVNGSNDAMSTARISRSLSSGQVKGLLEQSMERMENIITELVETENSYVESLQQIYDGYLIPLRDESLISTLDERKIFSIWEEMLTFHKQFLHHLRLKSADVDSLAKVFCNSAKEFLRLYSPYCTNYTDALSHIEFLRQHENVKWNHFYKCQLRLQHQLPLATYLLKPVQRILKYHLLLQELFRARENLLKSEWDGITRTTTTTTTTTTTVAAAAVMVNVSNASLEEAVKCMLNVADNLNVAMQLHELHRRLRHQLCQLNDPRLPLHEVERLGDLVLCDYFHLVGKRQPRFVCLFHSAMLMGKVRSSIDNNNITINTGGGGGVSSPSPPQPVNNSIDSIETAALAASGLVLKEVIQCTNLMIIECVNNQPLCFHVLPFDNPKNQVTLQAQNIVQKQRWCTEMKRLILEHYDKAIPEKARKMLLSIGANHHPTIIDNKSGSAPPALQHLPKLSSDLYISEPHLHSPLPPPSAVAVDNVSIDDYDVIVDDHHHLDLDSICSSQPVSFSQRHCRNPSTTTTTTTDFLSLWDTVVAKHSSNNPLPLPPPPPSSSSSLLLSSTTSTSTLGDNNLTFTSSTQTTATDGHKHKSALDFVLSDDMDFRCIAVEINEEKYRSGDIDLPKNVKNGNNNQMQSEQQIISSGNIFIGNGATNGTSTSILGSIMTGGMSGNGSVGGVGGVGGGGSDIMSVYEAYIARARSKVDLTEDDLEEILRPLRMLSATDDSGGCGGGGGVSCNKSSAPVTKSVISVTSSSSSFPPPPPLVSTVTKTKTSSTSSELSSSNGTKNNNDSSSSSLATITNTTHWLSNHHQRAAPPKSSNNKEAPPPKPALVRTTQNGTVVSSPQPRSSLPTSVYRRFDSSSSASTNSVLSLLGGATSHKRIAPTVPSNTPGNPRSHSIDASLSSSSSSTINQGFNTIIVSTNNNGSVSNRKKNRAPLPPNESGTAIAEGGGGGAGGCEVIRPGCVQSALSHLSAKAPPPLSPSRPNKPPRNVTNEKPSPPRFLNGGVNSGSNGGGGGAASPTGGNNGEEEDVLPPRGLVSSMRNRFQS